MRVCVVIHVYFMCVCFSKRESMSESLSHSQFSAASPDFSGQHSCVQLGEGRLGLAERRNPTFE